MPSTHTSLHYHLVFSTKDRRPFITGDWREDLYGYLGGIVKNQGGILLAVGGIEDHVHLLVGLKTSHRLDYFLRELKASSSGWVRREKNPKFAWQMVTAHSLLARQIWIKLNIIFATRKRIINKHLFRKNILIY